MNLPTIVLFGLPGAGKTFIGRILQKHFGYYFHDGDWDLPDRMRVLIDRQAVLPVALVDLFFERLISHAEQLYRQQEELVISQTFIRERYRTAFLQKIPDATFILIQTDLATREARLKQRKEFPLDLDYARKMVPAFELPQIPHKIMVNDEEGESAMRRQLKAYLSF